MVFTTPWVENWLARQLQQKRLVDINLTVPEQQAMKPEKLNSLIAL